MNNSLFLLIILVWIKKIHTIFFIVRLFVDDRHWGDIGLLVKVVHKVLQQVLSFVGVWLNLNLLILMVFLKLAVSKLYTNKYINP